MKENIKIGLLGIIALASVANVFMLANSGNKSETTDEGETSAAVAANVNTTPAVTTNQDAVVPPMTFNDNTPEHAAGDLKKTSVHWDEMFHDFGKIKQDSENKYAFKFTNTGTEPLVITNAVGSCGCTVPEYPKDPVMPGASATINVVYKPGKQENQQEKTVTVTANTEPIQTILKIRAFVEKN